MKKLITAVFLVTIVAPPPWVQGAQGRQAAAQEEKDDKEKKEKTVPEPGTMLLVCAAGVALLGRTQAPALETSLRPPVICAGSASPAAASTSPSASSWMNGYVVLGCCLLLVVAVHRTTVASIVQTWSRDPFAHGYFAVAAAAYLAWTRRERVASTNPRPAFVALPFLGLLSFLWLLGTLISATLLQQVSLLTMFVAVAWAVLGSAAVRALNFPFGLLLFAVPLGERLAPTLQELTARAALTMLTLSGVHPVLEDHRISIAENTWHVTQACGGINYLVASLAVGYVYAGTVYRQWGHRVAFLVASALVPLAANAVRVYATILLDHLGATRVASGMLHYLFGALVFGIMMSVLFVTCGHWREGALDDG